MVLTSKLTAPAINVASLTFVIATDASSCAILKMFLPQGDVCSKQRFAEVFGIELDLPI
jgi:hypothetical protein